MIKTGSEVHIQLDLNVKPALVVRKRASLTIVYQYKEAQRQSQIPAQNYQSEPISIPASTHTFSQINNDNSQPNIAYRQQGKYCSSKVLINELDYNQMVPSGHPKLLNTSPIKYQPQSYMPEAMNFAQNTDVPPFNINIPQEVQMSQDQFQLSSNMNYYQPVPQDQDLQTINYIPNKSPFPSLVQPIYSTNLESNDYILYSEYSDSNR